MKNITFKLIHDEYGFNPRTEFDNLGTIYASHKRYDLSDKDAENNLKSEIWKEFPDVELDTPYKINKELSNCKNIIWLSVYMYDHSGICINTTGYSCPWDSGQVGVIFITKDKIKSEYSYKNITKKRIEIIEDNLRSEIGTYSQYLEGDCYGFNIIDKFTGATLDSCFGFYGSDIKENGMLDNISEEYHKQVLEQI